MKKAIYAIFAVIFTCVFLNGCSKKDNAESSRGGGTGIQVDAVKITDDIDSAFKVQAQIQSDNFRSGGGDLGIVGNIEDGKLTVSIANPEEDFLHDPLDLDLGCDTEGMRIGELKIATSGMSVILDNSQSGWSLTIWFANKDGNVNFYGADVPFKKGWNFFEGALGVSMENPQIWTSLQDVYEKGYYRWTLAARQQAAQPVLDSGNTQSTETQPASVLLSRVEINDTTYSTYDLNGSRISYIHTDWIRPRITYFYI